MLGMLDSEAAWNITILKVKGLTKWVTNNLRAFGLMIRTLTINPWKKLIKQEGNMIHWTHVSSNITFSIKHALEYFHFGAACVDWHQVT